MGIFFDNSKFDLLKKTQENLALSQANVELATHTLERLFEKQDCTETSTFSDDEKRKAAYALNLCMVSVSQIIDYNDMYILDQEYQAILNNLNLEEMPKDEALLNILKQMLDVITFFRIQDGDRKLLEKEYQQKMKNAIWSAVPNIGLLVAGGSLITTAFSLASQVGIGYMNYRKEKAQNSLDKERSEWQLQRSAMEQLNGLRRELFDTAWRLAERYQFPDRYRITEQQITRYNEILLDLDPLRRYERLDYIKEKFEAYPPFWYYLGAAANRVYQTECYDSEIRGRYRGYACEHFSKFIKNTEGNLLREDQILASGALEYLELLIGSGDQHKEEQEHLIDRAIDAAGNVHDVLELCALSYLQLGLPQKAAKIFRMLVNDGYNQAVNAQLLSSIYVDEYIHSKSQECMGDYNTLCRRVGKQILFPMPQSGDWDGNDLNSSFIQKQKALLCGRYALTLKALIKKYSDSYNSSPNGREEKREYIFEVFNQLYSAMQGLPFINSKDFSGRIKAQIRKYHEQFKDSGSPVTVTFTELTEGAFQVAVEDILSGVKELSLDNPSMVELSQKESELQAVCTRENIVLPELAVVDPDLPERQVQEKEFTFNILDESEAARKQREVNDEMSKCIKKYSNSLIIKDDTKKPNVFLYQAGESDFDKYFGRHWEIRAHKSSTLAVINDVSVSDDDLLLTTDRVFRYKRSLGIFKLLTYCSKYGEIKETNSRDTKLQIGVLPYQNKYVNLEKLHKLFKELGEISDGCASPCASPEDEVWEMIEDVVSQLIKEE